MTVQDLRDLSSKLPVVMTRKDVEKHFGGLYTTGYLANLDSEKKGPKKGRIGRKVVYKSDDFIEWLIARLSEA